MVEVVSLQERLRRTQDYWSPKIVGELNETHVKVVKSQGEFVWHHSEQ